MIRCSCRTLLQPEWYSFLVATDTVIDRTSMPRPKISREEPWSWQKRWLRSQASQLQRLGRPKFGVDGLDDRIDEIVALVIRQECAFHRIDCDLLDRKRLAISPHNTSQNPHDFCSFRSTVHFRAHFRSLQSVVQSHSNRTTRSPPPNDASHC